jgi:hypothetical protein
MTDLTPDQEKLNAGLVTKPEAKPFRSSASRYAAVDQAHKEVMVRESAKAQPIPQTAKPEAAATPSTSQEPKSLTKEATQDSKPLAKQDSQQIFLGGCAQVPVACSIPEHAPETVAHSVPRLARTSPHAPLPLKREKQTRKGTKDEFLRLRIPAVIKAKLKAKAAAAESYPSAYVLKLIAADLCLPINETQTARSRGLQEQIAALTVALNKQGGLFNQIAAAVNKEIPCPVTRQEIEAAWRRHTSAINAILKLGFD